MKRFLILALCLTLALAACGKGSEPAPAPTAPGLILTPEATETPATLPTEPAPSLPEVNLIPSDQCSFTVTGTELNEHLGLQIHVLDRKAVKPVELGVKLIRTLQKLYPNDFKFRDKDNGRYHIDVETGTDEIRLNEKTADEILEGWEKEAEAFAQVRAKYSLYK